MKPDVFYVEIGCALSSCQLVEQELKLYISEALELAAKCVGSRMPFKLSGADYDDAPLGRLIEVFTKLADDPELVRALRRFKGERDFLTHRGISYCLNYEGELDAQAITELRPRLAAMQEEGDRLRIAIHENANKFRGHLWFEEFPSSS